MARSRADGETGRRSGAGRVFAGVAILVVVLAAALTGAWYWLAGELDRHVASALDAAAGGGTTITCDNRGVFGYPFRIGLSCDSVGVDAPENGIRLSAGSLRTAAQVYQPSHIVAELAGPLRATVPDLPTMEMNWSLAQGSTSLWSEGMERVSIAVDQPVLSAVGEAGALTPLARSARLETHARQNGAGLDFALSDTGVVATIPPIGDIPAFDLAADLTVDGAADWLRDGVPGGRIGPALRGQAGLIRTLRLTSSVGATVDVSGPFRVSQTGEISGDFRLGLQNPQAIAQLVSVLVPGTAGIASTIAGGIGLVGRQENGQTVLDVAVRDGEARLGFIPLGRLPRI
ncbi:DUF2125 domain-containing protein [Aureimonas sp. Leaf324]|jgi:hypothetical protein|uniref:DUF2125 domain-containing protein n=1 Tax=Aureimonas sp. Leaf324 TaxID=1736336 RepID=UPI000701569F|nr:DUF2125 domain-containing protein [Aureimonas sp. Leaf324]KQQ79023.1 hypothetical protein ASF65_14220 [Aureimonas sp. Leaf324]